MKRFFSILTCLCALLILSAAAYAQPAKTPLLVDNSALLSKNEAKNLLEKLENISEAHDLDVAVLTSDGTEQWMSTRDYCEYFFEQNYGRGADLDGVILYINMDEREWHIATSGKAISAITDYGLEYIEDEMLGYLSIGSYYNAFSAYADACDSLLKIYEQGDAYDRYNGKEYASEGLVHGYPGGGESSVGTNIVISLTVGVIVALISVSVMKGQLKSVKAQTTAHSYVRRNSLMLTQQRDIFLYRSVKKVARPKETTSSGHGGSTVHRSSSGHSFGGRGGKF